MGDVGVVLGQNIHIHTHTHTHKGEYHRINVDRQLP